MDNYIYRLGSTTNILGKPPRFYHSSKLIPSGCKFASVYATTAETAYAIEETAKTCQGFKGIVWSQRLWIDIDQEDASRAAQKSLKELGYDYVVYTTGNRGCHIGILRNAKPSHTLPAQDKAWVSANIGGADLSLYWHLHLIRLPGTLHEKTSLSKKLIFHQEGRSLSLPELEEEDIISGYIKSNLGRSQKITSIFSNWEVMKDLTPTNERRQLVRLAASLKTVGSGFEEALWIVSEVNKGFNPPRDQNDVDRIVKWAFNKE